MRTTSLAPSFDAIIDLTVHHLAAAGLPDTRSSEALAAVRSGIQAMPGAGWIDVEYLGAMPLSLVQAAEDRWIRVFKAWNAVPPEGPEWTKLRQDIEARLWEALRGLAAH